MIFNHPFREMDHLKSAKLANSINPSRFAGLITAQRAWGTGYFYNRGMYRILIAFILMGSTILARQQVAISASAAATYYVSSSSGLDSNPGTLAQPFKTIARVNQLQNSLNSGDKVLFHCGDVWRGEMLVLTRSGTAGNPIEYSSYPPGCTNQPVLSGTQTITGWTAWSGNIYAANLGSGENAARFPADGINQLFRDGSRLTMGRWPNLDAGDGGYASVDAQPDSTHLTDNQLPGGSWIGAVIHLKVIRWSMINRVVSGQNGQTLQLNTGALCAFTTNCTGWGYFINNSLQTLDRDGEWYYDKASHRVYLYATSNPNSHLIEGSIVPANNSENLGAVNLGKQLGTPISNLVVDNFKISGWYKHGIASPTNLSPDENAYITLQNNRILDVDADGINLFTWVYAASDGQDDWRGGNHITILNNLIQGANHFGIHTPSRETTVEGNIIRNIALIENLNESGMGCGMSGSEGTCTEDGAGLRIYRSSKGLSGNNFTVRYNRFERIGANGVMIFGYGNTVQYNVFSENCYAKGDCGAVNTFGGSSLATSPVHDIVVSNNIIRDTIGNTDGTHPNFRALFAFGLYIDHNSKAVTANGNTILRSTVHGILYQNSSGSVTNNVLVDNVSGSMWGDQVALVGSTALTNFSGNVMVSRSDHAFDLGLVSASQVATAGSNRYDHSLSTGTINLNGQPKTLAQWQALSGKDAGSITTTGGIVNAYFVITNETRSNMVYNFAAWPTCDLNGIEIAGTLSLAPYTSRVVYRCGPPHQPIFLPVVRR